MALTDQIVESHTRTATAVGATTANLSNVTLTQADGASTTGRYQLHAAVAVSSSSANVEITGLSFGSEDMAPSKSSEVTTAGARPATRMFSAGEWPTGAQTPTVTVSGGNIDAVVVYFFVLDEVAEECLAPFGTSPRTDTFNRLSLNPMWTNDPGDGTGGTVPFVQTGGIINLVYTWAAGGGSHYQQRGPNVQQSVSDGDFSITVETDTQDSTNTIYGAVAEVAGDVGTYVLAAHYAEDGVYFASYSSGSESVEVDDFGSGQSEYTRLVRSGDDFTFFDSSNGSTFANIGTLTSAFTVARVGFTGGTYASDASSFNCFGFINDNAAVTRTPQDADTALQFLSTNAASATSASLAFTEDTTAGAGLVNIGIIAASEAAGAITAGAGDELLADGLVSSTDGIRYAIVGALTEVSGTTSGTTISGTWTGAAPVSMSGDQMRVEALPSGGVEIAGTATSVSGSTADLDLVINASGTADAVSGSTADLEVVAGLVGTSNSVSGSTANLEKTVTVSGTADAVSGSAADLSRTINASGTADSVSGSTANLQTGLNFGGSLDAVSGSAASLDLVVNFAGTADSISGSTADLQRGLNFSGTSDAVSGSAAILEGGINLAGTATAVSGSAANLDRDIALAGTADAVSGSAATLEGGINLAGTADSVSGSTADLQRGLNFSGTVDSVSGSTADLLRGVNFAGTADSVSGSTADLLQSLNLAGASDSVSGSASSLVVGDDLQGVMSAVSGSQANLTRGINLGASSDAVSGSQADLVRLVDLGGVATSLSGSAADLVRGFNAAGQLDAVSGSQANLNVSELLAGQLSAVSGSQASVALQISLQGIIESQSSLSGTFEGTPQVMGNFVSSFEAARFAPAFETSSVVPQFEE